MSNNHDEDQTDPKSNRHNNSRGAITLRWVVSNVG